VLRAGSESAYRAVAELAGESHVVRTELWSGVATPAGQTIACFAHVTDLHVTDPQSPARFEFINAFWADERFRPLLTMQRPQEMLNTHAVEAMVRAINEAASAPLTGHALQMVLMTGDAIDNTQRNELTNFLALFDGGTVHPDSGSPGYEGVQQTDWPGEIYWKPDGAPEADVFQRALGFPSRPGLLDEAAQPFRSDGLRIPWLGCYGNHEEVCQGVGLVTPDLAAAMTASRKPVGPPPDLDAERAVDDFTDHPEKFMAGDSIQVASDPERRPISREGFVDAHVRAGGHGFTDRPYYVNDGGRVRFIVLDTVCDAGGAGGSLDRAQLYWLERRLEEVHATFRTRDGSVVRTGHENRYVVLVSHHGYDSLDNPRGDRHADDLVALLSRFPNVVLWLNGHIHANRIAPRGTFWEVTTGSVVDWPCQARLVEIYDKAGGGLAIGCTMLDHDGAGLAGLHRELAANAPFAGFDCGRAGTPGDRNAILLLPAPF